MMLTINVRANVDRLPSDVWGLAYRPTLLPGLSDERDHFFERPMPIPAGGMFSDANAAVMATVLAMLRPLRTILEIGVGSVHDRGHSSTDCILARKPDDCWYVGVDHRDDGRRAYVHDPNRGQRFIECDSSNIARVTGELLECDRLANVRSGLDLLWIDGHHSVKQVLLDWRYAELVRPGGIVLMHDTNWHPGPALVFDAVDESLFTKTRLLSPEDGVAFDYGMGLLQRRAD